MGGRTSLIELLAITEYFYFHLANMPAFAPLPHVKDRTWDSSLQRQHVPSPQAEDRAS